MDRVTIYENEKISVWCHPGWRIIHHQMHQACYKDVFREALTFGVQAMGRYGADAWLSDDRANGPVAPEDDEWIAMTWLPRALAMQWRHWAILPPVRAVGRLNVARTIRQFAEMGVTVHEFAEPSEALAWLRAR